MSHNIVFNDIDSFNVFCKLALSKLTNYCNVYSLIKTRFCILAWTLAGCLVHSSDGRNIRQEGHQSLEKFFFSKLRKFLWPTQHIPFLQCSFQHRIISAKQIFLSFLFFSFLFLRKPKSVNLIGVTVVGKVYSVLGKT